MNRLPRIVLPILLGVALSAGCDRIEYETSRWMVMGTVATVKSRRSSADCTPFIAVEEVSNAFDRIQRLLNAHDPGSELSKLSSLPDEEVLAKCDRSVRPCYEAAFRLRDQSGGAFDPRWRGTGTLDLGGIAKGFAVDAAVDLGGLRADRDWHLDLGGNIKACRGSWKVGIAGSDRVITLTANQACATSAEYFRGKHIRDARTGNAVTNGLLSVTVIHPNSAMLADGLSTVCFILGEREGEAFLRRFYPETSAIWLWRADGRENSPLRSVREL